jgi:hypothetical protein
MAVRRPIVLISGRPYELPAADTLPVPRTLPFWLASEVRSDINLTTQTALPFTLASGAASNIPLSL